MSNLVNLIKLQYNSLFALKKNLLVLVALSIFLAIVQPFMISFAGAMFLMVACYSVVFYEERSKINYLIYSLPITTNEYILSKYIYGILNTIIAVLISSLLATIVQTLGFNNLADSIPVYSVALTTAGIGVFFVSVLTPATLLLGFEKGRYALIFIAILPITFSTTLVELLPEINISLSNSALVILGLLISITVLLTSYFITCNRFAKKEVS